MESSTVLNRALDKPNEGKSKDLTNPETSSKCKYADLVEDKNEGDSQTPK